jgi:hypothetical protein
MKRTSILFSIVAALFLGGFAGFCYASHRYSHAVADTIASYEFARASDTFTTLRDLRASDTNTVLDALESQLDTCVISIDAILEECPTMDHAENWRVFLGRIADYRADHPYHDDDKDIEVSVTEILSNAKKESR